MRAESRALYLGMFRWRKTLLSCRIHGLISPVGIIALAKPAVFECTRVMFYMGHERIRYFSERFSGWEDVDQCKLTLKIIKLVLPVLAKDMLHECSMPRGGTGFVLT